MAYKAFWSYVHNDNDNDAGRVLSLGRDIVAEYEAIVGEPVELFIDEDAIRWGEEWQSDIDHGLATIAFFVPILTPRFFLSSACRRETQTFLSSAKRLGAAELILPLLYIDAPQLHVQAPADQLVKEMKKFQWMDWRDLRFESRTSPAYRRGVNKLANRLLNVNIRSEPHSASIAGTSVNQSNGTPDVVNTDQGLHDLARLLRSLDLEVDSVDMLLDGSDAVAVDANFQRPPAEHAATQRALSEGLGSISSRISSLGMDLASSAYALDAAGRAIGFRAALGSEFQLPLDTLVGLTDMSRGKLLLATSTIESAQGAASQSRSVAKALNQALLSLEEVRGLFISWRQDAAST